MSPDMNDVIDNRAAARFELTEQGDTAIAAYTREGDTIVFTHTEVPPALEGHGVGSRLIAGALAQVRAAGLKVVPVCAFVAAYLRRHPDAADLA
ncbi:N-acetyltransferase [Sphingomonas sp. RP10(2022)]|uniref:N-acetyltransferase n=1 Tax=Sphingomonas liriopis TaxID=2949094 RepID=A0A9X2HXY8_9SPHN|nr:GNAT family N-acetyltransferase [Sphingomonas liriopis]MCP3734115.1 N-acetyltransferase [Sphingomonas liriopis]